MASTRLTHVVGRLVLALDTLYDRKEALANKIVLRCPAIVQIFFMERVMKSVKASYAPKETGKVLFTEEEGGIRTRRRYRPTNPFRTPRMDVLGLPKAYKQIFEIPSLYGRDGRAYSASIEGWQAYLEQHRPGAREV